MELIYRWSLYTGGAYIQVELIYRWSLYTGGAYIQVEPRAGLTVIVVSFDIGVSNNWGVLSSECPFKSAYTVSRQSYTFSVLIDLQHFQVIHRRAIDQKTHLNTNDPSNACGI